MEIKGKFIDLLPDNIKANKDVIKFANLFDESIAKIDNVIDKLTIYARLDDNSLEEKYVDGLAKTFHLLANEGYRFAGDVAQKRELVRNALILHKTKGTKYAVEKVCNLLDLKKAKLVEWFEEDKDPYTFRINANAFDGLNQETIRLLYVMVDEFKNLRSHISQFEFEANSYGTIYTGLIYNQDTTIELREYFKSVNRINIHECIGICAYIDHDIKVGINNV